MKWELGVDNTKTFKYNGSYHNGCKNCNAITPLINLYIERQLLGNCYQSLANCSVCGKYVVADEYKLSYRPNEIIQY